MGFTEDFLAEEEKRKKKKKKTTGDSFTDEFLTAEEERRATGNNNTVTPVAPVAPSAPVAEPEKRTWFDSGAFDDGYQFGDVFKTIGGTIADAGENLWAGILGMGEATVDALAYVGAAMSRGQMMQSTNDQIMYAGLKEVATGEKADIAPIIQSNQAFQQEVEKGTSEFIKKDLYDEEEVAHYIVGAPTKALFNIDTEEDSVLGEKSDSLVQSAGQLTATAALQAVGVPWWLTTGVTTFGEEADSALNQGATFDEAGVSAAVSAGAEILTEKISGGISFGGKTLDDVLTKELSRGISNKVVATLTKLGIDAAGEGFEEILSGVMSAVGQKLTYAKEEELFGENGLFSTEDAFESFVGGAVLGGGSSVVSAVKSGKEGADFVSGMDKSEKLIVDTEYNSRVKEAETDGKKLTQKEKRGIYDQVLNDLEKGYISTDTIEKNLGGDDYKAYQDTVNNEDALIKELDELRNMKSGDMTDIQKDRLTELKEMNLSDTTKRDGLKKTLSDNVLTKVKNTKLAESYNERARRGQRFEADLTKYDKKQAAVIQKAIDSGILNNSNRTHEFVDMVSKISADKGVSFDFANNAKLKESGFAIEGKTVNGFVTKDGVTLNLDSAKSLNTVVGHEISHVLEGTELYTELQKTIIEYAKSKGDYQGRYDALTKLYEGVKDANIDAELTADLVGEYLFTDQDFVNNLSVKNRNVFQKVYDEIKYLCKVATAGSKEARELEKVKKTFENAYKQSGKASEGTKYSMSDEPIFDSFSDEEFENLTEEDWDEILGTKWISNLGYKVSETTESAKPRYKGDTTTKGKVAKLTDERINRLFREYGATNPEYAQAYVTSIHPRDFLSLTLSDESLQKWDNAAAEGTHNELRSLDVEKLRGELQTPFLEIDTRTGEVIGHEGRHRMRALLEAGVTDVPIAVVDYSTKYSKQKEASMRLTSQEFHNGPVNNGFSAEIKNLIPLNEVNKSEIMSAYGGSGDIKYSLSDNTGKALTNEQNEFFKDSKMRDENGNLMVMYHGSQDAGFHVFDPSMSDDGISLFFVNRNDVAASYSGTSETYEAQTIHTAEDMNNFIESIGAEGYEVVEKDGKFTLLYEGERVADSNTAKGIYSEFCWYEGVGEGDANYKVYLNLTNPLEIDAKGRPWNKIDAEFSQEIYDKYNSLTDEEKAALHDLTEWEDFRLFNSEVQEARGDAVASAYAKMGENCNIYDLFSVASENFSEEAMRENARGYLKTRDYAQRAKEGGYDGVIIKNVHDNGGYSNGSEGASTVAIAFKSEQVKSVANEKPTRDPDMRYSLSKEGETTNNRGWNVRGEDIKLSPMQEDISKVENTTEGIAPKVDEAVDETVAPLDYSVDEAPSMSEIYGEDYAPMDHSSMYEGEINSVQEEMSRLVEEADRLYNEGKEDEAQAIIERMQELTESTQGTRDKYNDLKAQERAEASEHLNSLTDADAPPEVEAPYNTPRGSVTMDGESLKGVTKQITDKLGLNAEDSAQMSDIIQKYARGEIADNELFETIQREFIYSEEIDNNAEVLSAAKKHIRNTRIYVPDIVKGDFPEYNNFRKQMWGKRVFLVKDSSKGIGIDSFYQELNELYPSLFPADIENTADQLMQIADVIGSEATINYRSAPYDADTINEVCNVINNSVREYSQGEIQKQLEGDRESFYDSVGVGVAPIAPTYDTASKKQVPGQQTIFEEKAPTAEAPVQETAEDIAPIAPVAEKYEAIRPQKEEAQEAEPRMKRVDSKNKAPSGKEERSWVETSTGSEAVDNMVTPDDIPDDVRYYQVKSNKKTLEAANRRLEKDGYAKSREYFEGRMTERKLSVEDIALGERLIQEAAKAGDAKAVRDLIIDVSIIGTELGQRVQALSMIRRLTPEGQLKALIRTVERGKAKGDKAFDGVEVTEDMAKKITDTIKDDGTFDQADLNAAVEDVKQQIADQMKITVWDRLNAWRYLSMLGNPKTHIRNVVSNVAMFGTRAVKNAVARTVEDVALRNKKPTLNTEAPAQNAEKPIAPMREVMPAGTRVKAADRDNIGTIQSFNPNTGKYTVYFENKSGHNATVRLDASILKPLNPVKRQNSGKTANGNADSGEGDIAPVHYRTKTWARSTDAVKAFAKQTTKDMESAIKGDTKYSEEGSIKAKRQMFAPIKPLNVVNNSNQDALEGEDYFFSRPAFEFTFREYLTANGIKTEADIKNNPELIEKAKDYALEEARKATFRQDSYMADKIREIENKNKALGVAVGSIMPFKKTPINIAKTGVAYSPLGFARNIYDAVQVKKGNMDASEAIDHLAQTLTGTSLTLIGFFLASAGHLNGAGDDDKEGKYDYQLGEQSYSFNFGGNTYSLSWLSPVSMPLFVGANAYEKLVEKEDWDANVVVDTLAQTLDPLSEMSFLSSLDDVLSSYDSGVEKIWGAGESMVQNYATQFIPTLSSQVAQTFDDTKRSTKASRDSGFKFGEETLKKVMYKIPGLRNTLEPTTDIWGNDVKQTENFFQRGFESFLSPANKREGITTEVDEEIKDLYRQTGKSEVIPAIPSDYINYDGVKYDMSAEEHTAYKQTYGQTAHDLLEELFDTNTYKSATSEERAEMVRRVYDYARDKAKYEYFAGLDLDYTNAQEDGKDVYREDAIKGAIEADLPVDEYVFSTDYPEKYKFFNDNGISYETYKNADEDDKRAYTWAYENPGKYTLSKAVSDDFLTFYKYRGDLFDLKADKDEDGKTISGSKKEKVIDYINNMNLDYGQKIILYRSMYDSKEDRKNYNNDILDYLNSRDDISYEDTVTILKELGFTVDSNGNVYWD
jgi:hypothetical protein